MPEQQPPRNPDNMSHPDALVWIVNYRASQDFSDAERYTAYPFETLTEEVVHLSNTDKLFNHLLNKLSQFRDYDYLLISGSPLINMIVTQILTATYKLPAINVLIFNGFEGTYYARRISAPE